MTDPTFNAMLSPWQKATPSPDAGKGRYFQPGTEPNLRWQTRTAEPTTYESDLAETMVKVYEDGGRTPHEFADGLNQRNCLSSSGQEWTAESIAAEMSRLGR